LTLSLAACALGYACSAQAIIVVLQNFRSFMGRRPGGILIPQLHKAPTLCEISVTLCKFKDLYFTIFKSKMKLLIRGGILFIIIISFYSCFQNNAQQETFLIPEGLTGKVTIFYSQKNGAAPKFKNKRRIYEILNDATLLTQFESNDGWVDQEYYYVDKHGNQRRIFIDSTRIYFDKPELAKTFKQAHIKDTLIMLFGIAGKSGANKFQQFYIGTY
jgi:hypothetical protein